MNANQEYSKWADRIIPIMWIFAGVSLVLFVMAVVLSCMINRDIKDPKKNFNKNMYYLLESGYTVFITIISLFPFFGMLGTVLALLGLDITGETEALKNNFFQALNTTMFGLVASILGKLINSFFQSFIETQLEKAKEILKDQD